MTAAMMINRVEYRIGIGAYLAGADLTGANLSGVDLTSANLMDTVLTGAKLSRAVLTDAVLRRAVLRRANLSGSVLTGANLIDAELRSANLMGADLTSADLTGAVLRCADLTDTNLMDADLTGVDLTGANLRCANLTYADLTDANLSCANLTDAVLTSADLTRANLSGAKGLLNPAQFIRENFRRGEDGRLIVYKTFGSEYPPPGSWKIEPGSYITEVCNADRADGCSCGVNVATRGWIDSNAANRSNAPVWECRIDRDDECGIVVPYNTNGKIRCERVQLIRIVSR